MDERETYYTGEDSEEQPRKKRWPAWVFLLVIFLLIAAAVAVYWFVFRVAVVEASPSAHYSAEELVEAAAIPDGVHLYSFSSRDVEARMRLACPYVKSIEMTRTVPDTIMITVTEDTAVFYTELMGETWALSAELRLLERLDLLEAEFRGLLCLRLPEIAVAVAGTPIEFAAEQSVSYVYDVLEDVRASSMFQRLDRVDLCDKTALVMIADGLYRLEFGPVTDCALKLRIAEAVLRDKLFDNQTRAKLDLANTSETSVIVDNQISLD